MLGLVLEGGGAKGAYQIGSYFALKEMGYEFDAVVGTSIGAINAAMIVMGEAHIAAELWKNTSLSDYYVEEEEIVQDGSDSMFSHFKNLMENVNIKRLPLTPLKNLVYQNIDEEKIRNSKLKFGLVTVNVTDRIVEEKFAEDIPRGELRDYIIASCYLPIFKRELINGKTYLDGGFVNQIPFNMVQKLGLRPLIVRANPKDLRNITIPEDAILIEPNKKHVSTMEFSPIKADELMRIGYFDTYKKLKGYHGEDYYIKPFEEKKALEILEKLYLKDSDALFEMKSSHRKFYEAFLPSLAQGLKLKGDYTYSELLSSVFEFFARKNKWEVLKVYENEELEKLLTDFGDFNDFNKEWFVSNILDFVSRVFR